MPTIKVYNSPTADTLLEVLTTAEFGKREIGIEVIYNRDLIFLKSCPKRKNGKERSVDELKIQ